MAHLDVESNRTEFFRCGNGALFWYILQGDKRLLIIDKKSGDIWRFDYDKKEFLLYRSKGKYTLGFEMEDNIFCLDEKMNCLDLYDRAGNKIRKIDFINESKLIYEVRIYNDRFSSLIENDGTWYFLPFSCNGIVKFDPKTYEMDFLETIIPKKWIVEKQLRRNKEIVYEKEGLGLMELMESMFIRYRT